MAKFVCWFRGFFFFWGWGEPTNQPKIPTTTQGNTSPVFTPLLMTASQGFILPTAAESVCLHMLSDTQLMGILYTAISHSQIGICIHKNRKWAEIKNRQTLKSKCSFTILNANSSFY